MLSFEIIIDWLQAALRWAAPLIIVSVGEIYSERSGVVNMGIEGIMLFGALIGVGVSYYMNSLILAVVFTVLAGAVLGLAVAFLTVSRRTNQVVTGLMVNMVALGAFSAAKNRAERITPRGLPPASSATATLS